MIKAIIAKLYRRLPLIRELRAIALSQKQIRNMNAQLLIAQRTTSSIIARHHLEWVKFTNSKYSDPKRISGFHFQVCSQNGEDGIIQEILRRIGTTNRVFFESGVGDGVENNSSFLLALGWSGYWVDANPRFLGHAKKQSGVRLKHQVATITKENVVELMEGMGVPYVFDVLSLDIDQNTYHVWDALSNHFAPRLVVIEYNGVIPPQIEWVVEYDGSRSWDGTHNFGASLKSLELLGRRHGYVLVGCDPIGANAFFIKSDLAQDKFFEPYTAENHFEPARFHLIHRMGLPNNALDSFTSCGETPTKPE